MRRASSRDRGASAAPNDVDKYLSVLRPNVRAMLQRLRQTIRKAAPQAVEGITYRVPTSIHRGSLVAFAAFEGQLRFLGDEPVSDGRLPERARILRHGQGDDSPREFCEQLWTRKEMQAMREAVAAGFRAVGNER